MSFDDEIELSQKMNYCIVPDFEMNDDYPNVTSDIFTTSKKSIIADEEIMELIWQNGEIIMQSQSQSQNQRCMKKSNLFSDDQSAVEETVAASAPLYIQEDEMTSLLQSPLDDSSFADFLYTPPCSSSATAPPEEIDTTTSCSATAPAVEIDTTTSCAAVSSAAKPVEIDKIDTSTAEISPAPPFSRLILPQLRCTERELTHRLQNFVYNTQNSAAAEEISTTTAEIRPSQWPFIPQFRSTEGELTHRLQNFEHFSRLNDEAILRNCTSSCDNHHRVRASTIVESNERVTAAVPEYMAAAVAKAVAKGGACELMLTSSTSDSGGSVSASAELSQKAARATEDRKRKGRELADVEFESSDAKKQVRSSTSAKKSHAAEVHNLSERRRRDRINEKMRALQELIPRCNKADKASMLDEAIEYLKSLQLQVQMMSMGCNMVPMMYPGIPQYMPTMGMNMGMGMSMEIGMNWPMVPYPPLMPGPAMQNAAAAAQMASRYPLPAYHLPPFPAPDPSRIPVVNQPVHSRLNSLVGHNINQPRLPNFSDPYHQYFGLQQAQLMLPLNRGVEQPGSSKPNSCIEGSPGNH